MTVPPAVTGLQSVFAATPSPVAVVTTRDADGNPCGLTCNAVSSVSLDPPMLLVSISARARTARALDATGEFVVNFLAEDGEPIARRFAAAGADKFTGLDFVPAASGAGVPILRRCVLSWAHCVVERTVVGGDHVIYLADVVDTQTFSRPALMYYRRSYSRWPTEADLDSR